MRKNSDNLPQVETLFDVSHDPRLPLPGRLADLYGSISFPDAPGRAWVYTNFVSSLDGVVTLGVPGHEGGGDISGHSPADRMVMGLLRAVAGAVIITAGSLKVSGGNLWNAEFIFPELKDEYSALRQRLGLPAQPLHCIVTARGDLRYDVPLFQREDIPKLILTTAVGRDVLMKQAIPASTMIRAISEAGLLRGKEILTAIQESKPQMLILSEGGPHLAGILLEDHCLDELFLTIAPQVSGRSTRAGYDRLGFVAGAAFEPDDLRWSECISIKKAQDMLFLRYRFTNK
jgi:riboflavin biosynthesis pyrimidine reductase